MFDMTLAELVNHKPTTSMPTEDYVLLLQDKIYEESELQAEVDRLRGEIADMHSEDEEHEKVRAGLRALVEAIDASNVGKLRKVGSLVVVEDRGPMARLMGEALEAARKLL